MATVGAVLNQTVRQLLSGVIEQRNKLASTITASGTSVVCSYDLDGIRAGQVIEVDAELMYVWEAASGAKTLTVERGWNGTTAVAHTAGAIITLNPRFPRTQLLEALNDELDDLSSPMHGLYQIKSFDMDYSGQSYSGIDIINLAQVTEIIDLVGVYLRVTEDNYRWIRKVKLMRDMPSDDFSSTYGLKFVEVVEAGRLRVIYKAPFTQVTTEAQNLQNIAGLPASMEDIVNMGIQIRMMASREIKRNFTESQGDTRRAEEVSAGSVSNSVTNLIRMRRDRITAEAAKLARQYPTFLSRD